MVRTIYIDVLFLINLIVNYLLLYGSVLLSGAAVYRIRVFLGALIGAAYGVIVFFISLNALFSVVLKILVAALMVFVSFKGTYVKLFRFTLIFFGLSFAFAGTVLALYYFTGGADGYIETNNLILYINMPFWALILSAVFAYLLFTLLFRASALVLRRETKPVEIIDSNKRVGFRALVDTGNMLRDPFTNARVIIADYSVVKDIVPQKVREILDKTGAESFPAMYKKIPYEYKFRLIPYKTVNKSFDLLLAFKPEKILIDGALSKNALVALSPARISDGGAYAALI